MADKDKTIEPIDDDFDNVVEIISQPASPKQSKNKDLTKFQGLQPALGSQYILDLEAEVQKEAYGIKMGSLNLSFLTLMASQVYNSQRFYKFCTKGGKPNDQ